MAKTIIIDDDLKLDNIHESTEEALSKEELRDIKQALEDIGFGEKEFDGS